jgi:hypothetical protein
MKVFAPILCLVSMLAIAASAEAHFVWATVDADGKHIRLEVAEVPGDSVVPMARMPMAALKSFGVGQFHDDDENHMSGTLKKAGTSGGIDLLYGVFEDMLIHWSAKGAASVAEAAKPIGLPVEILLTPTRSGLIAKVTMLGKPASGAEFSAIIPGQSKPLNLKTGPKGTVQLPAFGKGLLVLSAIVTDPASGEYKGQSYKNTQNMGSLVVRV